MARRKKIIGHQYTDTNSDFSVETDYLNGKIYLTPPELDDDLEGIDKFGIAVRIAVQDFRKTCGD